MEGHNVVPARLTVVVAVNEASRCVGETRLGTGDGEPVMVPVMDVQPVDR